MEIRKSPQNGFNGVLFIVCGSYFIFMKNAPLVTVIVPVFNASRHMTQCKENIEKQDYPNLEIIIIDDGSKDDTYQLCKIWAANDFRVRVFCHNENVGASLTRQEGISLANGEYITFIDCDDIVDSEYISLLYDNMKEYNVEISACAYNVFGNSSNCIKNKYLKENRFLLNYEELNNRIFKYQLWGLWGKLYKKDIFESVLFPSATINEDLVVMIQLFHTYRRIAYLDFPLYHYIFNRDSLSHQALNIRILDEWINKMWCYDFYKKNAPKWLRHAEAQVAETCCKLINMVGESSDYDSSKKEMQNFLKSHFWSLLFNPHFVNGLKMMMFFRIMQ